MKIPHTAIQMSALAILLLPMPVFAQSQGYGPVFSLLNVAIAFVALFMVFIVVSFFLRAIRDILASSRYTDAEKIFWMAIILFLAPPLSVPLYFLINKQYKNAWMYIGSLIVLFIFAGMLFAMTWYLV